MRLLELLRKSTEYLEAAGIDDALSEAEMLVFHAVNRDRLDAYIENPEVKSADSAKVRRLLQRRIKGEPVQYIIGHIEFLGLIIKVGKGVLIPRPETELLVEEVTKTVKGETLSMDSSEKNSPRITHYASRMFLDICTGTGCIALALARQFPDAEVYGTDLSREALTYAKKNAMANGIKNVTFLQGSVFDPVKGKKFDIITANPPYIRRDEIETLQREVRDWEPVAALDGGMDGMDFYRAILSSAGDHLNPDGYIFLELGYDQSEDVQKIARAEGFREVAIINDYAGIGRILVATQIG
ncbi:MAG: peptide chain release factor N(5)-glutamine methyltransferase [Nitrospirae bacterium]|nr:peptide chain release factor N(5)-glutamine methyltransferase [Nitrospirota bacterium]